MSFPVFILASLLSGWILSLTRKGCLNRTLVILSVPVGTFLGGYGGSAICRLIFRLQGRAETQHDWIAWVDAGILGAIIGLILVPGIALAFTGRKKESTRWPDPKRIGKG